MRRSVRFAMFMVVALAFAAPLTQARAESLALGTGSKLWLTGSSTMHAFESTASRLQVTFDHDPSRWAPGVSSGEAIENLIRTSGVRSVSVVVDVKGMRSGKDGLDRNMAKALLADKCPEIRFRMEGYEVAEGGDPGEIAIHSKGLLTVAGVERRTPVSVTARRDGETVRLSGSVPLLMSSFEIKPPTMMMGALRTSDQVVVHFDLVIVAKDAKAAAKAE